MILFLLANSGTQILSQQVSAKLITLELFITYLQTRETKLTAKHMVYMKPQIEELNAWHTICVELHLWLNIEGFFVK
jgi:hypothetical protein